MVARSLPPLCLALLAACGGAAPPEPAAPPTRVRVGHVTVGPARPAIVGNGFVATRDELRLAFKVGGVVNEVRVREGDRVRAGQVLATLEFAEVDAQVDQARELATKAARELARGEQLRVEGLISENDLDTLRANAGVADAARRTAEFNRSFAVITSPRDGSVLRKLAEEREVVQQGQTVLVVGPERAGYIVRAGLADRDVVKLKRGDPATATLDACPGRELPGRVSEIPAAAVEQSGLFDVEVTLDEAPAGCRLVSGLVARLRIEPAAGAGDTLPYVPIAAIVEADGDRAAVFVPAGDVAERRPVTIAFIAGDQVAIRSGLGAGDPVITDGALYLAEGERIDVMPTEAGAALP
jgi:RND family efflux transporter MFP subunit